MFPPVCVCDDDDDTSSQNVCSGYAHCRRHSLFGSSIVFAGQTRDRLRDGGKKKGRSKRRGSKFAAGGIVKLCLNAKRDSGYTTNDGGDYYSCTIYDVTHTSKYLSINVMSTSV